jgi:hypothetical protein
VIRITVDVNTNFKAEDQKAQTILEEPVMEAISNTAGVNLVKKVMFGSFFYISN